MGTTTTNLALYKPDVGETGWGTAVNGNCTILDNALVNPNPAVTNLLDLSGAAAGQIKFPTTQNASAHPNTLDDYEEGSWTPALTFSTPGDLNVVYGSRNGTYVKIGRKVTVMFYIQTSNFTHTTANGNARITGLPFSLLNQHDVIGSLEWAGITKASYTAVMLRGVTSQVYCELAACGSGQGNTPVTKNDMPTGGTPYFGGTLTYQAQN